MYPLPTPKTTERKIIIKRLIAILLSIALLVMASGCTGDNTEPTEKETDPKQTEATEPSQPEQTDALTALRARMEKELIAVADFGFPELSDSYGIIDYLQDQYPWWLEENEFVRDMPEELFILTCDYGTPANLVCIVPAAAGVTMQVNVGYTIA